eukprot:scpid38490/ scgid0361/ 
MACDISAQTFLTCAQEAVVRSSTQLQESDGSGGGGVLPSLSVGDATRAFHEMGLNITFAQVLEMMAFAMTCDGRYLSGDPVPAEPCFLFGEFCWYAAQFLHCFQNLQSSQSAGGLSPTSSQQRNLRATRKVQPRLEHYGQKKAKHQVFLGGACNPTVWREKTAIPYLKGNGITYYNPQRTEWHPDLIAEERTAKNGAAVNLLVVDEDTRGTASIVEAAYMCAGKEGVVPVIRMTYKQSREMCNDSIVLSDKEVEELNYARALLIDYAEANGVLVFNNISQALQCVRDILVSADGIATENAASLEESSIRLGWEIGAAHEAFVSAMKACESDVTWTEHDNSPKCRAKLSGEHAREAIVKLLALGQSSLTGHGSCRDVSVPIASVDYNQFLMYATLAFLRTKERNAAEQAYREQARQYGPVAALKAVLSFAGRTAMHAYSMLGALRRRPNIEDLARCPPRRLVHLGGSCGRTTWRDEIAIPYLEEMDIEYDNPQTGTWTWRFNRIPEEVQRLRSCSVLLFVITSETRSAASMVDAATHIGLQLPHHSIIMYIEDIPCDGVVDGETLTATAVKDYNRGRAYLRDICKEKNVPQYKSIMTAVKSCVQLIKTGYYIRA